MAKRNKISVGKCYSYHDHVYMVVARTDKKDEEYFMKGSWTLQDTLNKNFWYGMPEDELLTWRRPFQNYG